MLRLLLISALAAAVFSPASFASSGDMEQGREVYEKRCSWCHGKEGAGDGPAGEYLNPPPRDFTLGLYKWKSTPFDEYAPSDDDFRKMVSGTGPHNGIPGWDGMNGTSMPGWSDVLSRKDIENVTGYIKSFADLGKPEKPSISLSGGIKPSKESIERGRRLFKDRCSECHGEEGRGDATKKLKDDWGARTWPRDLSKGWTFRVDNSPEEIYARVTAGIPGTQMPSFADPASKKVMTDSERWDVANYAASLDEPYKKPGEEGVVLAVRVTGALPENPSDGSWKKAQWVSFYAVPQIIYNERSFRPSINSISAKALYNEDDIAILVEWGDPTRSMPWDEKAKEIAGGDLFPDAVAIQFPASVEKENEKPYFGMGDTKAVNIWSWQSEAVEGAPQTVKVIDSRGFKNITVRDGAGYMSAKGVYDKGVWRVVFRRPLKTGDEKDIELSDDKFIPVAFAAWDGSNGDTKGRHVMTQWHSLRLAGREDNSFYAWPVAVGILVLGAELLWLRGARRKKTGH